MTTIIDANAAISASTQPDGFDVLAGHELAAPPLLWPEVRSSLHRATIIGGVLRSVADNSRLRFERARIREVNPDELSGAVWELADALGWAKTYDAEYLALASLLDAPLLTLDRRVQRAAERLGIGIAEI